MKRRLLDYIAYVESVLAGESTLESDEVVRTDLLLQIQFFQHERLVHLLVTLLFALLFVGTTLFFTVFPTFPLLLLDLLFLILLVPYIRHYYLLENGTQRLYRLQDKLWQRIIEERKKSHP
jgi:hypothetical protein